MRSQAHADWAKVMSWLFKKTNPEYEGVHGHAIMVFVGQVAVPFVVTVAVVVAVDTVAVLKQVYV